MFSCENKNNLNETETNISESLNIYEIIITKSDEEIEREKESLRQSEIERENLERERLEELARLEELENQRKIFERAKSENDVLALKNFIEEYKDSEFLNEAENKLNEILNNSQFYDDYYSLGTLDGIEEFLKKFPGHKDENYALERLNDFKKNLSDFSNLKYISGTIRGKSIKEMELEIKNRTISRIIVELPVGLCFDARNGYVQNMINLKAQTVEIKAGETVKIIAEVACLNIFRDAPSETDYFTPRMPEKSSTLKLDELLSNTQNEFYEVIQAAIWILMDNPGEKKVLESLQYENGANAINHEHYIIAQKILENYNLSLN